MVEQLPTRRRCPRLSSGQLCLQVHIMNPHAAMLLTELDGFDACFWLRHKLLKITRGACWGRDRCTHRHRATGDEEGKESCGGQCSDGTKLELRPWCRICEIFQLHVLMWRTTWKSDHLWRLQCWKISIPVGPLSQFFDDWTALSVSTNPKQFAPRAPHGLLVPRFNLLHFVIFWATRADSYWAIDKFV